MLCDDGNEPFAPVFGAKKITSRIVEERTLPPENDFRDFFYDHTIW
jgi:hypothetical protein